MIELTDINAAYDKKPVLWNISMTLPVGEVIGIIGPNGAGKSTLIKCIAGLHEPLSGCIKIDGAQRKKSKGCVAYVGQRSDVDWNFPITAFEVAMMGLTHKLRLFSRPTKTHKQEVMKTLEDLGLKDVASRQIGELSGGQQRRLFVARALLQNADVYLLDEPFAGIDLTTEKLLMEIFSSLAKAGKMVVVVHHDLTQVKKYFSYLVMLNIHLIAAGKTEDVFHYQNFSETFGDQANILKEALELTQSKQDGDRC